MLVDLVTCKRSEYELIDAETGIYSDPPEDPLASVTWPAEAE